MLRTTLIEFAKYLPVSVDKIENNIVGGNKYIYIRKSRNEIIEILSKSKVETCLNLDLEIYLDLKKFKVLIL